MPIELTKVCLRDIRPAPRAAVLDTFRSADGLVDFDLAQPGTTPEPAVNPETLFAAGYAACFSGSAVQPGEDQAHRHLGLHGHGACFLRGRPKTVFTGLAVETRGAHPRCRPQRQAQETRRTGPPVLPVL